MGFSSWWHTAWRARPGDMPEAGGLFAPSSMHSYRAEWGWIASPRGVGRQRRRGSLATLIRSIDSTRTRHDDQGAQGPGPASSSAASSAGAFATPSSIRPFAAKTPPSTSSRRSPGTPTATAARRRSRARPGRASPIRTTTSRSSGSRPRERLRAGAEGLGRSEDEVARARHLRLAAQRRHLPRRDLEDLSPRRPGRARCWRASKVEVDFLDLSLLTSEYGRHIHPCKGCVSTAMPLCHWPCSCYPNHSLDQVNDWMTEIYERWVAAHAVIIVTPMHWYQTPSALKLMIDRLVCADGGNPDPTSTHGKKPGRGQGDRARRLGLSEAPRRPRLRPGGARRRRRHRGLAPGALRLARLDGPDRRRRPGAARPLHRLLRALRHQPRHARPRPRRCRRRRATSPAPSPASRRALRNGELTDRDRDAAAAASEVTCCTRSNESGYSLLHCSTALPRPPLNPFLQKILAATGLTRRGELVEATDGDPARARRP